MRRAYRRPVTEADLAGPLRVLSDRRGPRADFDAGIEMALARRAREPASSCSASSATRPGVAPRHGVSRQRPRAGVAPVVLPVEQHPGRRAARRWPSAASCSKPGGARAAGAADAGRPTRARAGRPTSPRSGCTCATSTRSRRTCGCSRTSTTTCGRRSAGRRSCFFESVVREDRSVLDLLRADYTFLNERLAKHYGIPHVYGSRFRRVDARRRQRARRAAAPGQRPDGDVVRDAHVAGDARQVGAREPARHAAAAAAAGRAGAGGQHRRRRASPVRERLAEHRRNAACASCHELMDPVGFALENFDAVGRWRTREEGEPIDAAGGLPDGSEFDGRRRARSRRCCGGRSCSSARSPRSC